MNAALIQRVVVIISVFRIKSRLYGRQAGVGYWSGRQSLIKIGVIGAVYLKILIAELFPALAQRILHSGVYLKMAEIAAVQAVLPEKEGSDRW